MRIDWMYHTGFVVSDMDRSLAFYRDLLGLEEERNSIVEDEFIGQLLGYPGVRIHTVYLGIGDTRHSLELVQFLDSQGGQVSSVALNNVGAAHLGFLVDDVDSWYSNLLARGVKFVNPPAVRPDAQYPWARKACYVQDPDGNWLEFVERSPAPGEGETA